MTEDPPVPDNWREEMENFCTDEKELTLLREGPRSLAQSWHLMSLRHRYKKIKGIKDIPDPDCQSSFKDWNKTISELEKQAPDYGVGK